MYIGPARVVFVLWLAFVCLSVEVIKTIFVANSTKPRLECTLTPTPPTRNFVRLMAATTGKQLAPSYTLAALHSERQQQQMHAAAMHVSCTKLLLFSSFILLVRCCWCCWSWFRQKLYYYINPIRRIALRSRFSTAAHHIPHTMYEI